MQAGRHDLVTYAVTFKRRYVKRAVHQSIPSLFPRRLPHSNMPTGSFRPGD
jgi:hypothetical protein